MRDYSYQARTQQYAETQAAATAGYLLPLPLPAAGNPAGAYSYSGSAGKKARAYLAEIRFLLEFGETVGDAASYSPAPLLAWSRGQKNPNNLVPTRGPKIRSRPKSKEKPG